MGLPQPKIWIKLIIFKLIIRTPSLFFILIILDATEFIMLDPAFPVIIVSAKHFQQHFRPGFAFYFRMNFGQTCTKCSNKLNLLQKTLTEGNDNYKRKKHTTTRQKPNNAAGEFCSKNIWQAGEKSMKKRWKAFRASLDISVSHWCQEDVENAWRNCG